MGKQRHSGTATRGNSGNSGTGEQRHRGNSRNSGMGEQQEQRHGGTAGTAARGNSRNSGTGEQQEQRHRGNSRNSGTGEQQEQRHGGTAGTAARGNSRNSGTGEQQKQRHRGTAGTAARGNSRNSGTGEQQKQRHGGTAGTAARGNSGTAKQRNGGTATQRNSGTGETGCPCCCTLVSGLTVLCGSRVRAGGGSRGGVVRTNAGVALLQFLLTFLLLLGWIWSVMWATAFLSISELLPGVDTEAHKEHSGTTSMETPEASLATSIETPEASLATMETPEASLATSMETPEASLATSMETPEASLATSMETTEASLATSMETPEASLATSMDTPEASLATIETPEASMATSMETPEASLATMETPEASLATSMGTPEAFQATMETPEASLATMETPEASLATMETPEASLATSMETPEASLATMETPEASLATSMGTPEASLATMETPEASLATMDTPEASLATSMETPEASLATMETPEASRATMETPEASLATMETPEASLATSMGTPEASMATSMETPEASLATMETPEASLATSMETPEASLATMETPEASLATMETPKAYLATMGTPEPSLATSMDTPEASLATSMETHEASLADWANTPQITLVNIFTYLPVVDRQNAAQVCAAWQTASSHPVVWRRFDYGVNPVSDTFDRLKQRFDELHARHGQYVDIIETHSHKFSHVHIVLYYSQSYDILKKLAEECRNLNCCVIRVHDSTQLSEESRRIVDQLLSTNTSLQDIRLKNVNFFAGNEMNSPFPIGPAHTRSLRKLSLVNSFRQNNLSALMYLINVTELTVVPQQIRFTWLHHLAKASLRTLNIVNTIGVWKFDFHTLPEESWKQIAQLCPRLRVNCYIVDVFNCSKLLCHGIPLSTLSCCEYFNLKLKPLHQVITRYAETLTTLVYHSHIQMSYRCQPLAADDQVLAIVRSCPQLRTLAVKDSLHSSTLLLLVQLCPSFRDPVIREDMIHYQLHIPEGVPLSPEVRDYTAANFGEDNFVPAMSRLLQSEWRPLPQKEYFRVLKARYNSW
ncbi:hypothetical protein ACOMHN_064554 [Nucella lapillus]